MAPRIFSRIQAYIKKPLTYNRIRRLFWVVGQPLSQQPKHSDSVVSDLFVWKNSTEWQTFFDLIDIASLFGDIDINAKRYSTFVFFDSSGTQIMEKNVELVTEKKLQDLSELVRDKNTKYGTFAIFHSNSMKLLKENGSFLAERGYVSYRYNEGSVRNYVHGNLDAIARESSGKLVQLGSSSVFQRIYRLQHELVFPNKYEVAVVNPTNKNQNVKCTSFFANNGGISQENVVKLAPRGSAIFKIEPVKKKPVRIELASRMVMARPLVFRICNSGIDVFHG